MSSRRRSEERQADRDRGRRDRDRSRQRRRSDGSRSPKEGRPRSRRRSGSRDRRRRGAEKRSRSPSSNARRREDDRRARREEERRRDEEQRERDREENEPSCTVLVHGIPLDATEERVEAVAWEASVQAGASMPSGVHFAYDRASQEFRGFAVVEFPHTEAAKLFKEHAGGKLSFDGGHVLTVKYHHPAGAPSRSRERGRGDRDSEREPSCTICVRNLSAATKEASLLDTFQAFATVKDIRHFDRRGFAFLQFHTIEDASKALKGFERACRSRIDGKEVVANFDRGRQEPAQVSAQAAAAATAQLEQVERQQIQQENTNKALSGVNAEMWAGYLNSVAQTETVQSSNTFQLDKESGFYLDKEAGLFYDPNTTYFFTLDYKKYFVYCHEESMLCHVDKEGKKVPGGERRPLPSQRSRARGGGGGRDTSRGRGRSRRRDRSRSRSRRRDRSRSRDRRPHAGDAAAARAPQSFPKSPMLPDGAHKPIHFPGGDPLARLAPAAAVAPEASPASAAAAAPDAAPKKKKKPQDEPVLGLAPMPRGVARIPGKVIIAKPGPVRVARPAAPVASDSPSAMLSAAGAGVDNVATQNPLAAVFAGPPLAAPPTTSRRSRRSKEFICEICMRKFPDGEMLRRHEEESELHKENLAKLQQEGGI